jgi:hypothetical protein
MDDHNKMAMEMAEREALSVSLAEAMEIVLKWYCLKYGSLQPDVLEHMYHNYFGERKSKEEMH